MPDHTIGKIFVELDLDDSRYTRGQKKLLKGAISTSLSIEQNFRNLGLKSSAEMDLMRVRIINSYEMIKNNAKATTNDIYRAEKAMNEKIKKLDEQQFGVKKSLIDKMRDNWVIALGAIYAAWKSIKTVVTTITSIVKDITWQAAKYGTFGIVMRVVGNNAGYTGEQMEKFSADLQKSGIAMMESRRTLMMMSEAHIDLAKAQQLGRIAQNAAVIGMMNSSQAMEQMIWGIQTANLRVLRTIGINVSFERSYQKMVAAMNAMDPTAKRTVENLTELEKITARTNEVIEFGPRIYSVYTAAMETAAKQALSLQRYWDNLKILSGAIFTPLFAQVVGDITGSIIDLNKDLRENRELMNQYGNQLRLNFIDIEIVIVSVINKIEKLKEIFSSSETKAQEWAAQKREQEGIKTLGERWDELKSKVKEYLNYKKTGIFSSWETIYPTKEIEDRMTKLNALSEKEIKNLKEKLKESDNLSETEKKLIELYETREKLIFSMSDEGKKAAKDKADAEEAERLRITEEIKNEEKRAEYDKNAKENATKNYNEIMKLRKKDTKELINLIEKNSIEREQIGKNLFEAEKIRIQTMIELYQKKGLNQVLIDQWAYNELKTAEDKYLQYLEKQGQKIIKEKEKEAKKMIDISKETAEAMESTFSDIFYDAMIGEMEDLKDYMLSFLKSIARALANIYAHQVATGILTSVATDTITEYPVSEGDYYGPYSSQSISTSSPKLSNTSMAATSKPSQTYEININAVDSKSFVQLVEENPQVVIATVDRALKNNTALRNTMRRTT